MPQIVSLPQADNTSLSRLGDIILGSAAQYGSEKRQTDRNAEIRAQQLQDQATARGNQLADVASARQYETTTHETRRQQGIQDAVTQAELQFKSELMRLGYKVDTAEDYAAARADFQKSELFKRYGEALADGSLTHADFGDAARMAAGLAKHDARVGAQASFVDTQRSNAGTVATNLANDRATLIQQADQLDRALSEPAPQPTMQQIEALAVQSLRASGQKVNDQSMAQARLDAAEKLRTQMLVPWSQMKQQQSIQRQLIESRLKDISAEMNTQANRFGVSGLATPTAASPAMSASPQPSAPNLAAARQNFASGVGVPQSNPVAAPVAPPAAQPTPIAQSASPGATNPLSRIQELGVVAPPMVQSGFSRGIPNMVPDATIQPSPAQIDAAIKATQDEIDQMFASGRASSREVYGANADRLHQLRNALASLTQRRQDQLSTIQARSSLAAPVSTATDTMPRAPAVDTGWWNPAVGSGPSLTAPTY